MTAARTTILVSLLLAALGLAGSARGQRLTIPADAQRISEHGGVLAPRRVDVRFADTITIRAEPGALSDGDWIETVSTNWWTVPFRHEPDGYSPRMASSFVARADDTNVAITFSAEARSSVNGKALLVRALVDGAVANPANVIFTETPHQGARGFTFTTNVDAGVHSVEIQWRVEAGTTGALRGASLRLRFAPQQSPAGTVAIRTAGGGDTSTTVDAWQPLAEMQQLFFVPQECDVFVHFSGETWVSGVDKSLWVRALIDGSPIEPNDVVLARSAERECHGIFFGAEDLAAGWHAAQIEWRVTSGGAAMMGDRSLAVEAFASGYGSTQAFVAAPSGPVIQADSESWTTVPGLMTWALLPPNGDVAIAISAEVSTDSFNKVWLRARVGQAVSDVGVVISEGGLAGVPYESQSFVFDVKHQFTGDVFLPVSIEWKVDDDSVTMGMGDRAMALVVEPGAIPDLAEGQAFAGQNQLVEPAIGVRKVLTILHDPHREGTGEAPDFPPPPAGIEDALFGPVDSVRRYFEVVSGGRFTIQNEGVLGWFDACKPWQHYWNIGGSHDCDTQGAPAFDDGFNDGWFERIYEAVVMADPFVDYASYDTNQDGMLDWQTELAILVVTPQSVDEGKSYGLLPFCPGEALDTCQGNGVNTGFTPVLDGVEIRVFASWNTNLQGNVWVPTTGAHELAHELLALDDMYIEVGSTDTDPRRLSLMAENRATSSYIDAMNRLALGWAEPVVVEGSGTYVLEDVRTSEQVLVLPRFANGDGREFYVLENRQGAGDHPLFDEGITATGIALWHVIEDGDANQQAPVCASQTSWDAAVGGGNARKGIRLVRPYFSAQVADDAWNNAHYSISAVGKVCPAPNVHVIDRRNVLRWADGAAGGYVLENWSVPGPLMSVDVTVQ